MNIEQGMQVADLAGTIRRRGKTIVVIAGAVLLVAYWVAMALPNQYSASALILVEPQSIDESLVKAGVRDSDLNQRLGIMTSQILSRPRLSSIIDQFELYKEEWSELTREEIVQKMRAAVSVNPVLSELEQQQKKGKVDAFNTFAIAYVSDSPTMAAAVANRIADDFILEHIDERVKMSQKSLDFMEKSIRSLADQIRQVDAQIGTIKRDNPGRLPEDLVANQQVRQRLLSDLGGVQRSLATAESDEAFWKSQILAVASMSSPNDDASPARRRGLLELRLAEKLSMGFTEKHPDVIQIRSELAVLERQIRDAESKEAGEDGVGAVESFAEQNARSEQRRAALRVESAIKELARIERDVAGVDARLADTPAVSEQLGSLERQYSHLQGSYQDYSRRLQEATVQADLERRQLGEQLKILEPAFVPPSPVSPNRMLLLALGLMAGIALGGVAGLVAEGMDGSMHSAKQLQSSVSLPVLAEIPMIILESDRMARTRRQLREVIAMAAIVVFCLVGGAVTYVFVNGSPGENPPGKPGAEAPEKPATEAGIGSDWSSGRG